MEMIAEVEAEQTAVAEAENGPAARLAQLRGIGLAFATVLGNEVFFRAFRNRREVGGYLGLAPSPWQSGGVRRDQGIAKSGDCDRAGLAVAAPSTGQRPDALVPRACGLNQGLDASDPTGCDGAKADRLLVAICDLRLRGLGHSASTS